MTAHRKTAAALKLSGALKNHPARYAARNEERTKWRPLGPPPTRCELSFSAAWSAVVECAPERTLTARDRLIVEECAVLLQAVRAQGSNVVFPLMLRFEKCLSLLGLTPADSARVISAPPLVQNVFDDV